jgi:hypothetical protein
LCFILSDEDDHFFMGTIPVIQNAVIEISDDEEEDAVDAVGENAVVVVEENVTRMIAFL